MNNLEKILTYRRPAFSETEEEFIKEFISCIKGVIKDDFGNYFLHIPTEDGKASEVMFSSHTDTVHWKGGMQQLSTDGVNMWTDDKDSNCLGADDGVGIYLMLRMIEKKIPGTYAFFRAEERGGQGSGYVVDEFDKSNPDYDWLNSISKMISFDRKGTSSVITHQGYQGCSETFANELCAVLSFELDDTGVFTDSANFFDIIDECTNLSVGYFNEHTTNEYVDAQFVESLAVKLMTVDWENLPVIGVEDPGPVPWWDRYDEDDEDDYGDYYSETFYKEGVTDREIVEQLKIWYPSIYKEMVNEVKSELKETYCY